MKDRATIASARATRRKGKRAERETENPNTRGKGWTRLPLSLGHSPNLFPCTSTGMLRSACASLFYDCAKIICMTIKRGRVLSRSVVASGKRATLGKVSTVNAVGNNTCYDDRFSSLEKYVTENLVTKKE